jgi:hypothetical protein
MAAARVLGVAACLCASACLPFPHVQQRTPWLQGLLTDQGAPVAGVPVHLVTSSTRDAPLECTGEVRATTDAAGWFSVPATSEFELFMVLGDRMDTWELCFELADGRTTRWAGSGWWGGPRQVLLRCKADVGACEQR